MERWVKIDAEFFKKFGYKQKPEYVSFVLFCITNANPLPKRFENLTLQRGQFVTSLKDISTEIGVSVQTCRTMIKNLTTYGFLIAESTNKFTVITICNYGKYQDKKVGNQQTSNNQSTGVQQTDNNQSTKAQQTDNNQSTTTLDNKNNRITDFKEEENKETFLKNGGTAEKKVFQISELEKILSAENIYMTAQGYQEFKNLNESDDRYGYKGGVIRSAKIFLKNPKNAIYRKNAPPAPRPQQKPPDQAALKAASEIWEKVKKILAEEIMPQSFKTWILPIVPLKLESGTLKIQVPSQYFQEYLEGNYIQLLSKALNDNGIKQLIYSIKIKN